MCDAHLEMDIAGIDGRRPLQRLVRRITDIEGVEVLSLGLYRLDLLFDPDLVDPDRVRGVVEDAGGQVLRLRLDR